MKKFIIKFLTDSAGANEQMFFLLYWKKYLAVSYKSSILYIERNEEVYNMKMIIEYEIVNSFEKPIDMMYICDIISRLDSIRVGLIIAWTVKVPIKDNKNAW